MWEQSTAAFDGFGVGGRKKRRKEPREKRTKGMGIRLRQRTSRMPGKKREAQYGVCACTKYNRVVYIENQKDVWSEVNAFGDKY